MATTALANLKPGDGDDAIEVRVIRKWTSFGRKSECCYVFIDRDESAIQAVANLCDKAYFDSIIAVNNCYRIRNYICENAKMFMIVVPHETTIRLGRTTQFQQIPGDDFPIYYFNFVEYDHLLRRLDRHRVLTDYIGKMENITDAFRRKDSTMMKMKLENLRGMMIEATFWDETATSFNKQAVMSLPSPVIVAVTSMKVTQFRGDLQLTATPASYIYVNPEIDIARTMTAEFKARNDAVPLLRITYDRSDDAIIEKHRNRFTLSQLLDQNPNRYLGVQFTCKAAVTRIDEGKGWFYKACSECHKKLQPRGNALACSDHDQLNEPTNLYFFTTHIADHTAEVKTIFFDKAATMLLGSSCNTMIDKLGFVDQYTLPEPLMALRGQTKVFQVRYRGSTRATPIEFVADHVFEDTITPSEESRVEAKKTQLPVMSTTTTPASTTSTEYATRASDKTPFDLTSGIVATQSPVQTEKHKKQRHSNDASDKKIQPITPAKETHH